MARYLIYLFLGLLFLASCKDVLQPKPVDILVDEFVLNEPADVEPVRIGLYASFRAIGSPLMIAGDFTADHILHNGTLNDYRELGTKQITAANGVVDALWNSIFRTIYVSNFLIEKLPTVSGVPQAKRNQVIAEARFLRGFANFIGAYTYGDIPQVITIDQKLNRTVPRVAKNDILVSVLNDYNEALKDLPDQASSVAYATKNTVRAALARYYLYQKNWAQAELFATQVISAKKVSGEPVYSLERSFAEVVLKDFPTESIFEVGYTATDDPGTSDLSLNNLFVGRREVIPSLQVIVSLLSAESGERRATVGFNSQNQKGNDNGFTGLKYGTASDDNNNIIIMRLPEMYLIRAEARAQQEKLAGASGAIADLNVLRTRAKAPAAVVGSQADVLQAIERERVYELAFEGHRWYDLVRTGRVQAVMSAFTPNWNVRYERWPIPQSEIQQNKALKGQQNPGY